MARCSSNVDVVESDRHVGDDAEVAQRTRSEHLIIDTVGEGTHDRVELGRHFDEFAVRVGELARRLVHVVASGDERISAARGKRARDEDACHDEP